MFGNSRGCIGTLSISVTNSAILIQKEIHFLEACRSIVTDPAQVRLGSKNPG